MTKKSELNFDDKYGMGSGKKILSKHQRSIDSFHQIVSFKQISICQITKRFFGVSRVASLKRG